MSSPEHQHSYKSDLISSLSDLATMARDHPLASSLEAEKLKSTNWHVWGGRRTRPVGTCEKNAPGHPPEDGQPGEGGKHRDVRW